jgi:hypothetical protein
MDDMLMDWLIVGLLVIAVFQLTMVTLQLRTIGDNAVLVLDFLEKVAKEKRFLR